MAPGTFLLRMRERWAMVEHCSTRATADGRRRNERRLRRIPPYPRRRAARTAVGISCPSIPRQKSPTPSWGSQGMPIDKPHSPRGRLSHKSAKQSSIKSRGGLPPRSRNHRGLARSIATLPREATVGVSGTRRRADETHRTKPERRPPAAPGSPTDARLDAASPPGRTCRRGG